MLLSILLFLLYALLLLLGLILLIIFTVLFIPIKYSIYSEKTVNNVIKVRLRISWFFRLFSCKYSYNNEDEKDGFILRIFAYRVKTEKKKPKSSPKTKSYPTKITTRKETDEKEKASIKAKQVKKAKKQKKEGFFDNFRNMKEQMDFFLNYPDKKLIITLSIDLIKKILNNLKPTTFSLKAEIGLEQPHTTGLILAATSQSVFFTPNIDIVGNFDETIFVYEFKLAGKISLIKIVVPTTRYLLKRPIRKLIKNFI